MSKRFAKPFCKEGLFTLLRMTRSVTLLPSTYLKLQAHSTRHFLPTFSFPTPNPLLPPLFTGIPHKTLLIEDAQTGSRREVRAQVVVNAAGLHSQEVARGLLGVSPNVIPARHLARGCYFTLEGERSLCESLSPSVTFLSAKGTYLVTLPLLCLHLAAPLTLTTSSKTIKKACFC